MESSFPVLRFYDETSGSLVPIFPQVYLVLLMYIMPFLDKLAHQIHVIILNGLAERCVGALAIEEFYKIRQLKSRGEPPQVERH